MDEHDRTPMTNKADSALVHTKDISATHRSGYCIEHTGSDNADRRI